MNWSDPVVERRDGHLHVEWSGLLEWSALGGAIAVIAGWVLPGGWFYVVVVPSVLVVLVISVIGGRRRNAGRRG